MSKGIVQSAEGHRQLPSSAPQADADLGCLLRDGIAQHLLMRCACAATGRRSTGMLIPTQRWRDTHRPGGMTDFRPHILTAISAVPQSWRRSRVDLHGVAGQLRRHGGKGSGLKTNNRWTRVAGSATFPAVRKLCRKFDAADPGPCLEGQPRRLESAGKHRTPGVRRACAVMSCSRIEPSSPHGEKIPPDSSRVRDVRVRCAAGLAFRLRSDGNGMRAAQ